MKNLDFQDLALRVLIVICGSIAAVLLALKGQAQSLPALAVGGTLGAFLMHAGTSENEE
jgi:hypothetical protein